jgi:hypothetical protein
MKPLGKSRQGSSVAALLVTLFVSAIVVVSLQSGVKATAHAPSRGVIVLPPDTVPSPLGAHQGSDVTLAGERVKVMAVDAAAGTLVASSSLTDEELAGVLNTAGVAAEVNYLRQILPVTPTVELFAQPPTSHEPEYYWGHYDPWHLQRIGASLVHGAGRRGERATTIAIVDTGGLISTSVITHQEILDRVVGQFDFVEGDAQAQDNVGHGWHVTGIAHSVCPECSLLIVKALDYYGGDDFTIARGIRYAVNQGADVINASFGGPPPSRTMCAAVQDALDRDVLFVAAAGNSAGHDDWSLGYPVRCDPRILVVSASDRYDQPAFFSNYGDMVDIMAPGVEVWSTIPPSPWNPEGLLPASGTSMAAPNVAGAAGLLKSSYPLSTSLQIAERLRTTAREVGTIPGVDDVYGPRLDVAQAFGRVSYPLALGLTVRQPWVPRDGGDVPVEVIVRGEGIRAVRLELLSGSSVERRLTMEQCGSERYCTLIPILAQPSGAFRHTYVVQAVVENSVGSMYSLQELIYQVGTLYLPIVRQSIREGGPITPTPDDELTVVPPAPTLIPILTPATIPE